MAAPTGRPYALAAVKAGITRLREKGGANPESLYDFVNGYVDAARAPVMRPGTRLMPTIYEGGDTTLPPGTKGLMKYGDLRLVFSHDQLDSMIDAEAQGYSLVVLRHPSDPLLQLKRIHFAKPYMGQPFVVAEFTNGDIFYYWIESASTWQADHVYKIGEVVQPTIPNGFFYRANRIGEPGVTWTANVAREVGDVVEPTKYNGYEYVVIDVLGENPRSGTVEPTWPAIDGAVVYEDSEGAAPTTPEPGTTPTTPIPPVVDDRYFGGPGAPWKIQE